MTSAGQAAAAALRMHSSPIKLQPQQHQHHQQQQQQPRQSAMQRNYTGRSNSLSTGRSNSMRLYTYNPKPSYSVGNANGRSYSLSSRHSYSGRPGVTSPLQHEYIHEEGTGEEELMEEEEVITTKTTRVVDSSGRTTSITTKTIRTLPDGSNIIETTTKNISRSNSRLNSLSSASNPHRGVVAADVNLGMIEEFENFEYSRSDLDTELNAPEKLKLNTDDVPKQQLGAAFSPTQNYERTTSLSSTGKPRSILKNSAGSIMLGQNEPPIVNGTHNRHELLESPPSSIRFNPKVQTRKYSPKETPVKPKKEKLTDEELYAAAYKAANKKVFGDGHTNVVQPPVAPPPPPQNLLSPETVKKSKYTFIPLTPKEPVQPTIPSPKIQQKPAVVQESPKSPNYILTMRDQPQRRPSRKERAREEKRLAKAKAKEAEEEEKRRLKEEAEEEKRRAKEEAKLAKQQAEDEKKRLKEEAKLLKEQEKANKKKNFLDKFKSRRRSSASSHSVIPGESSANVENGVVPAAAVAAVAAEQYVPVQVSNGQAPILKDSSIAQQPSVQHVVQSPTVPNTVSPNPVVQAPTTQEHVLESDLEQGPHEHTEGSKTIQGHGRFYNPTDPQGVVPNPIPALDTTHEETIVKEPEVNPIISHPESDHGVASPVVGTSDGAPETTVNAVAPDTTANAAPAETTANVTSSATSLTIAASLDKPSDQANGVLNKAGIPTDSPIYYAETNEDVNLNLNDNVSPVVDDSIKVAVLKSATSSQANGVSEEHIQHVPVPHLQLIDDSTVDVELDNADDDETEEETEAIDVIEDYKSSSEEPRQAAVSQELPPPNVSVSTGNTPQITAILVMKPTVDTPNPESQPLPEQSPGEELVVENKEKGSKRQRFLKFFVL